MRIKKILRSRLPERFSGKLPPFLIEVGVGVGLTVLLAAARLALVPWIGEAAPYAFVFAAVVGAAVLAGWRSGLIALMLGQLLIWIFVMEPQGRIEAKDWSQVGGLVISTFSQLIVLAIIILYQREVAIARSKREGQMDLLQKALNEIDHRTVNNYQSVLALILAQAKFAGEGPAKEALQKIADRIKAIANASRRLAASSASLEKFRLDEHLKELRAQIEQGLSRREVRIECEFADDVALKAEQTTALSMLVNELLTNALKHAFPDNRPGVIRISLARGRNGMELVVEDDGVGLSDSKRTQSTGLGTRLVETFIKQLGAKHDVTSGKGGTRHRILIPA